MSAEQAYAQINRLIDQQAFTRAADDIFLASSFLFLSLIVLIWFTKRPALPQEPPTRPPAHTD
jgi:DHA2 family multidrug resistance protein